MREDVWKSNRNANDTSGWQTVRKIVHETLWKPRATRYVLPTPAIGTPMYGVWAHWLEALPHLKKTESMCILSPLGCANCLACHPLLQTGIAYMFSRFRWGRASRSDRIDVVGAVAPCWTALKAERSTCCSSTNVAVKIVDLYTLWSPRVKIMRKHIARKWI